MSSTNPTVPINVTAKELRVLSGLLGYNTGCTTLRDKLNDAENEMRLATRQKNRDRRNARKQKRNTDHHEAPANAGASALEEA